MQEFGGMESYTPSEGGGSASESLSEEAKQRFAASGKQAKQLAKEEKKAKKRDDRVAEVMKQFLSDAKYAHLFQLIAHLASRDCPSVFILSLLSLIHAEARTAVEEFIAEKGIAIHLGEKHLQHKSSSEIPEEMKEKILLWTTRMELVMNYEGEKILTKLMIDEENIDGAVLQCTAFILIDFFALEHRTVRYEDVQPIAIKLLQDLLADHMHNIAIHFKAIKQQEEQENDE